MLRSLRVRFVLALLVIQVIMLSAIVWNSIDNLRHSSEHRLFDTAQNLATLVAETSSRFLFEMDPARLGEYVGQTMTHDELLFVAVFDVNGRVVAARGPVPEAESIIEDTDPHEIEGRVLTAVRDVDISGQPLGRVALGFSLETMEASIAESRRQSLFLAAGLVLLTFISAIILSRSLTRDLSMVSDAVERYGASDEPLGVMQASTLEVQSVVRSLHLMAEAREDAERQRDETASFYRMLIERSSDVVIVSDSEGLIEFAGPSVTQLLGYEPDALVGESIFEFVGKEHDKDLLQEKIDGTIITEALELEMLSAEGEPRTLETVWHEFEKAPGETCYVLNCRDVTERRALENRVRATEKLEVIGQLTGGVAHDFNNQLAVIMGNLELISDDVDAAQNQQSLVAALKACERSADLTRNLLSFSRKSHLSPQITDLNSLLRDASSWIQRTLPSTINVETSLLAGLWPARLDPSALENALLNLVINARDAMPDGGALTIETSNMRIDRNYLQSRMEDLPEGQYVMLAVSDNGVGIPEENLEKIFQPFFTTKAVGEGSGLGLSSVHGFVRQSGGTIRVYTEPGTGTTFKLYFPAFPASERDRPTVSDASNTRVTRGARLLVVEDASDVLDLLRRTLEGAGYEVVVARNGDIGYQTFKADPDFDLLLTDIVMPGEILGTRLAKDVRAIRPSLPVVFITGYATEAAMYGNGLRPTDIRLMKPVRRSDLLEAVEKALSLV